MQQEEKELSSREIGMGVFIIILLIIIGVLAYKYYKCNEESEDCEVCCEKGCKCGGGSTPVTPVTPSKNWEFVGEGLSTQTSNTDDWGTHQNIDTNLDTLEKAQKWVKEQGGVALNYPTDPCRSGEPCEGGKNWYFFWSTKHFVGTKPRQPNGGWGSWELK